MRSVLLSVLVLVGCGGSKGSSVDAPEAVADTAVDGVDPRGPASFTLSGGANGLLWDAAASKLYLTDSNANALLSWTDSGGIETVGTWPTGGMISLGDLVKQSDGTILTTNFGFNTTGTIFAMATNNTSTALTGLAPERKRVGLGQDSAGTLYVAYFTGPGANPAGGVASVTIAGGAATETVIEDTGFKKLVGLAAASDAVYVADQTDSMIYKIAIPSNTVTPHATGLPSADLLYMMPNGDLLTGGTGVHRVTPSGTFTTILTGFEQVRGFAYDDTLKRLFIIEHSETPGTPDKLHVRPLDN